MILFVGIGVAILLTLIMIVVMYRIVPPTEAHIIVGPTKKMVCAADEKISTTIVKAKNETEKDVEIPGSKWYFHIPIVRTVRIMDITIKELLVEQETYEKEQARYMVKSSIKYRIKNVQRAAETFVSDRELKDQLKEVVEASVRAVTVRYDVTEARAKKSLMTQEIEKEITDDLNAWGLELINFQLVDFMDTKDSRIISDISERREKTIEAQTREIKAEKDKVAREKEALADQAAQEKEIARDKVVGERKQQQAQAIAEAEKKAKEKEYEVIKVKIVKQAEIDKEKAIVEANQARETEEIYKLQKHLEGEGYRLRAEEQAKGDAAPILQKGLAEAEAKMKLQEALNKFDDNAIRALVAEKVVEMQRDVGVAGANALSKADVRLFGGGDSDKGFDVGKFISSMGVANESAAEATLNKLARTQDLGFKALGLKVFDEKVNTSSPEIIDAINTEEKDQVETTSDEPKPKPKFKKLKRD